MQKELESLWQKCVAFHGHGCGGLAVGFRAVLYAWELFGSDRTSQDEEIVCIAETDACGVDAIQALMSCTVGKGNLIFNLQGKNAFSFYRRSDGSLSGLSCAQHRTRPRRSGWRGSWMGIFTRCLTRRMPRHRYRRRPGSSRPLPAPCAENDLPRALPTFKTGKSSALPAIVPIQGGCDGIPV